MIPILFIGFAAIGVVTMDEVGTPDRLLPYLVVEHMNAGGLVYGLIGAGALAAAMSSSDAITHAASVSFGRDVARRAVPSITERTEIWLMRGSVVAIGAVAYYLTIFGSQGLVQLLVGAYGSIVQFAPAVYGALYWRRGTKQGAIAGLVVGVLINFYLTLTPGPGPFDINPGIVGLIANLAVFVGVSLMTRAHDKEVVKEFVEA